MKGDYTTNSRYITRTIAFWKVGRMYFLSVGVKELNQLGTVMSSGVLAAWGDWGGRGPYLAVWSQRSNLSTRVSVPTRTPTRGPGFERISNTWQWRDVAKKRLLANKGGKSPVFCEWKRTFHWRVGCARMESCQTTFALWDSQTKHGLWLVRVLLKGPSLLHLLANQWTALSSSSTNNAVKHAIPAHRSVQHDELLRGGGPPGQLHVINHAVLLIHAKRELWRENSTRFARLTRVWGKWRIGRASFWGDTYTVRKWTRNLRTKYWKCVPTK